MRLLKLFYIMTLCCIPYAPHAIAVRSSHYNVEGFLNNAIDNLAAGSKFACKAAITCYAAYLAWPCAQKVVHEASTLLNHPTQRQFKKTARHTFIFAVLAITSYDFGRSCCNDMRHNN